MNTITPESAGQGASPATLTSRTLAGRVAIVTGSTSGIGLAILEAFAKAGAHVVMNGFGDAAELAAAAQRIAASHDVDIPFHGADMSRPAEIADLVATTEARFGRVDILVNNAGIQHVAPVDEFPVEKWDAILAINLSSAFHATQQVLPGMKHRRFGRIINIASAHGLVGSPFKSAYVAAKHGVLGLTKVTALETAEQGITANAICPLAATRMTMNDKVIEGMKKRLEADGATPVGNAPDEFAAFVKADVPRWARLVKYAGATPE